KMMDGQQQTARPLRAGIKPHRLHKLPSRRRKPPLRRPRMLADARLTRPSIKTANVDPPDAGRRIHRPSRRHLQPPPPPPPPPPRPGPHQPHRNDQAPPAAPISPQPRAPPKPPAAPPRV